MCAWFKIGGRNQGSLIRPLLKVLNFWINIASLAQSMKGSLLLTVSSTWPLKSATVCPCWVKYSPGGSVWTFRFLPFLPTLPAVLNLCMTKTKCNLTLLTSLTNITYPPLFKLISNCAIQILPFLPTLPAVLNLGMTKTKFNLTLLTFLTNNTSCP